MPELLPFKVIEQVYHKHYAFGIFLLNDRTGGRVKEIEQDCHMRPGSIIKSILQEWLEGKGLDVTWESLVQALRDTGFPDLADQIQDSKMHKERGKGGMQLSIGTYTCFKGGKLCD